MSQIRRTLKKRFWPALVAAGAVGLCALPARALGLGPGAGAAVWGQPLDFSVPLRLQLDRFNADVLRLRVQARFKLDEPIVEVQMIGSSGQPVVRAGNWRPVVFRQPGAVHGTNRHPRATATAKFPRRAGAPPHEGLRSPGPSAYSLPHLRMDLLAPQVQAGGAVEQALLAVAQAAKAARQSASAASAAAERIAALERTAEQLRKQIENNSQQAALLSEQLAKAESPMTTWVLGVLAGGFALLAAWLGRRLLAARRGSGAAWQAEASRHGQPPDDAPVTGQRPTLALPSQQALADTPQAGLARTRSAPAWPPPSPVDGWQPSQSPAEPPSRTRPEDDCEPSTVITATQVAAVSEAELASREVSIDELLDLEQQAEFFVALGQDDAAVELLLEHLQHTGGGSPLPFLKLLEIHRRRGDRSDYERMRARFNHRFNAYAPDWEVDLQSGRLLSDYPVVLSRLQQVWTRPLDSMAELEVLMFRTSQGELFDLPAYREVLLLYALARDLLDHESVDTGRVDLLLPLSDGGEFSSTAPAPLTDIGQVGRTGGLDFLDQPTAPIDLDLTFDTQRPTSIFDQMEGTTPGPRALTR